MPAKDIKTICNIGTGTMGPGTAVVFAMTGYKVRLFGRTDRSLDRGFKGIDAALESYREHDLADSGQITAIRARITGTTTLEAAAADADFVIETVAEDIETKRKVFAALDSICPAHAIFRLQHFRPQPNGDRRSCPAAGQIRRRPLLEPAAHRAGRRSSPWKADRAGNDKYHLRLTGENRQKTRCSQTGSSRFHRQPPPTGTPPRSAVPCRTGDRDPRDR